MITFSKRSVGPPVSDKKWSLFQKGQLGPGMLAPPRGQCPAGTRTRPATRYFFRYPTRFSFGNYRVAGNPKRRVLPDISGKPEVSGTTRYFGYHPEKENNTIIRCSSLGPTKRSPGCKKKCKIFQCNVKYDCGIPLGWTIVVKSINHIYKRGRCS